MSSDRSPHSPLTIHKASDGGYYVTQRDHEDEPVRFAGEFHRCLEFMAQWFNPLVTVTRDKSIGDADPTPEMERAMEKARIIKGIREKAEQRFATQFGYLHDNGGAIPV